MVETALVDYPSDSTGYKLDANCDFKCPHRHFSHLLQIFDLQKVTYGPDVNATESDLILRSIDTWYKVTCNHSNVFNEECRGFTQCGLASMNAVSDRPLAAVGNITHLIDHDVTTNGMYGEEVYMNKVVSKCCQWV